MILTQRDPGGAGVGVDPEGQPGEDDDEQRRGVNTHHVEADLSPQGEDDLHTRVVACTRNGTTVSQSVSQSHVTKSVCFLLGPPPPKDDKQNKPPSCKQRATYADLEILGQLVMHGCSTVK